MQARVDTKMVDSDFVVLWTDTIPIWDVEGWRMEELETRFNNSYKHTSTGFSLQEMKHAKPLQVNSANFKTVQVESFNYYKKQQRLHFKRVEQRNRTILSNGRERAPNST